MMERKESRMAAGLNLIDSENIGTINSIREIRRRSWSCVCVCGVYVCVCVCVYVHLTRLGNECPGLKYK